MSDDANKEEVSTTTESKVEDLGIDRTELERLQTQDARIKKLDGYADEANTSESPVENAEAYFALLEDSLFAKEDKPEPPKEPAKKEEKPKTESSEAMKALEIRTEASEKIAQQAQLTANNTELRVQYAQYSLTQDKLPEEERSPATREELLKILTGSKDRGHLGEMASRDFDGNVWAAANYIFSLHEGAAANRKAGADAEVAKANAIASAAIPGNRGRVADPSTKTPEEKAEELNKQRADDIYPDDAPFVIPI